MRQLWPLEPASYPRHPLHGSDRTWPESNCYVDLWIELLHTAGFEPRAILPFTLTIDIEGDQWTFVKCPAADLQALYGIDVIELNVYRPLVRHIEAQLALGRPTIVEVDAFYLPDTPGISYHTEHVKTSIAIQALDDAARRLGYFHNGGYFELAGQDYVDVLRIGPSNDPGRLPPYVEVAKLGAQLPKTGRALVDASIDLLGRHLANRPHDNPFRRWRTTFQADLDTLAGAPLQQFHDYAFATFRQFGAAFELAASHLRWLADSGEHGLDPVAASCDVIATTARTLQLKTARFVSANRTFDPDALLDTMAEAWDRSMSGLTSRYGTLVQQG